MQRNLVVHITVFMINTRFLIAASYLHVLLWWLLFTAQTAAVRAAAGNQGKFSGIRYKPQYSVFCQSSVGCNSESKSLLTSQNGGIRIKRDDVEWNGPGSRVLLVQRGWYECLFILWVNGPDLNIQAFFPEVGSFHFDRNGIPWNTGSAQTLYWCI